MNYFIFLLTFCLLSPELHSQTLEEADTLISKSVQSVKKADTIAVKTYQTVESALKKYMPELKRVMKEYVAPVTADAIKNTEAMKLLFDKSYEFLPLPVRMVVTKEEFCKFGLKHRYKLLKVIK